jgi:hypothetical protein
MPSPQPFKRVGAPDQRQRDFDDVAADKARRAGIEKARDELDDMLGDVVGRLGPKHVAFLMGIDDPTRIYKWLERRDNQRPPAEMLLAVLVDDKTDEAMRRLCDIAGYEVPRRRVLLPPEEQVRLLCAEAVKRFGPGGEEMIRDVLGQKPEGT